MVPDAGIANPGRVPHFSRTLRELRPSTGSSPAVENREKHDAPSGYRATIPNTVVKPRLREITQSPAIKVIDLKPTARENEVWLWGNFEVRRGTQTSIEVAPIRFRRPLAS